jgi:hypothetical protein
VFMLNNQDCSTVMFCDVLAFLYFAFEKLMI